MPQWGRPSGAPSDQRRRDWPQWDTRTRVEEVDTDEDDRLRFTGYDMRGARRDPRDMRYNDAAYGEEYDVEEEEEEEAEADYEQGAQWQLAMRQKEEELVDGALRRINRARLRGESDVNLSREEIDALERRQLIPQSKAPKAQPLSRGPKPKRRSAGGILGFGGPPPKQKSSKPRQSLPESSARNSPRGSTPEYSPPIPPGAQPQSGYFSQPSSRPGSSPSKPSSRAGLRMAPGPTAWIGPPEMPAFRPSSSSRASPTRSLPDDPNWMPRSRSSSAAQHYQGGADPFAYQTSGGAPQYIQGRRNISGPSTVSYSSLRRAPPPAGAVARVPSGSGLSQEVIEISSDEEDDDDDNDNNEDEDESDEGVTLDMLPEGGPGGYPRGRPAPPPPPPAGNLRSKRNRR